MKWQACAVKVQLDELELQARNYVAADESAPNGDGATASIHDRIIAKEPGLERLLVKDWYRRASLIDHFITALHEEMPDLGTAEFTPEAVEELAAYRWPGNIRELKNVIERLYVSDRDRVIHATELPIEITSCEPIEGTFKEKVRALRDSHGNQREAAQTLGLTYDQFRHHFKKYDLARK